jgi:hypothetical protein
MDIRGNTMRLLLALAITRAGDALYHKPITADVTWPTISAGHGCPNG